MGLRKRRRRALLAADRARMAAFACPGETGHLPALILGPACTYSGTCLRLFWDLVQARKTAR